MIIMKWTRHNRRIGEAGTLKGEEAVFLREGEDKRMDIKEQIKKAVDSISKDKSLQEKFQKDPVKALEGILGVDLPDDVINQVVQGVKAKLTADNVSGAVDALKGFLKK